MNNEEKDFLGGMTSEQLGKLVIRMHDFDGNIMNVLLTDIQYFGNDHPDTSLYSIRSSESIIDIIGNKPFSVCLRKTALHKDPEPVVIITAEKENIP